MKEFCKQSLAESDLVEIKSKKGGIILGTITIAYLVFFVIIMQDILQLNEEWLQNTVLAFTVGIYLVMVLKVIKKFGLKYDIRA
jgi:hypothetical protein